MAWQGSTLEAPRTQASCCLGETGPWYCPKCESKERQAWLHCKPCPCKNGALKRTDNGCWTHIVCALYILEVRFGNVTIMEPINLALVLKELCNKVRDARHRKNGFDPDHQGQNQIFRA